MGFYVIEIANYNDGTAESKGIYSYATQEEAIATFHSKMGGAMKNTKYESELLMVIRTDGGVIRSEKWNREHTAEPVEE